MADCVCKESAHAALYSWKQNLETASAVALTARGTLLIQIT